MASSATSLYDAAEALLIVVAGSFSSPIQRAYVSPGEPAADCNQATVHVSRVGYESTEPRSAVFDEWQRAYPMVCTADLVVQLFRCVTVTADPPPEVRLAADAELLYRSAWEAWNAVKNAKDAGTLFPDGCRPVRMLDGGPLATSGGVAGWQFAVSVQLDGIPG